MIAVPAVPGAEPCTGYLVAHFSGEQAEDGDQGRCAPGRDAPTENRSASSSILSARRARETLCFVRSAGASSRSRHHGSVLGFSEAQNAALEQQWTVRR